MASQSTSALVVFLSVLVCMSNSTPFGMALHKFLNIPGWVAFRVPTDTQKAIIPPVPTESLQHELQEPRRSVMVECKESSVLVTVRRDLLGTGQLIREGDVHLGGCPFTGKDDAAQVVLFKSSLQGCGSTVMMTKDELVYTFTLVYAPRALGTTPIVRGNHAAIDIRCHYLRKHNVSSSVLTPNWVPYQHSRSAEDILTFSLRLMTDDWQSERLSRDYFLGNVMNFEASVLVAEQMPLTVFVDSCVATMSPDSNTLPRYAFIQNHGCMADSKLPDSRSKFIPTSRGDKLRFQLDAFRFAEAQSNYIYITCTLRATTASTSDSQLKACTFSSLHNRWVALDGKDRVCSCCDLVCGLRGRRERSVNTGLFWQGDAAVGPVNVHGSSAAGESERLKLPDFIGDDTVTADSSIDSGPA